jgi:hypothetical protein
MSGDKIPPIDPVTGKFITPSSGNKEKESNMSNKITYIYRRGDGEYISCYGQIRWDSNFSIVCEDEEYDGIAADIDAEVHNTFFRVCRYLEKNYRKDILEIETC